MTRTEYHPEFSNDLAAAARYLETREDGLGGRFIDCVESACREIQANPLHHSYLDKPVRRIIVRPFSYAVHYALVEDDELFIYGVYHCAMTPEQWAERR